MRRAISSLRSAVRAIPCSSIVSAMTHAPVTGLGPDANDVNALLPGFLPTAVNRGFWAHRPSTHTTKE